MVGQAIVIWCFSLPYRLLQCVENELSLHRSRGTPADNTARKHVDDERQSERIAREGIDLSLSTLADLIGHICVALAPIHGLIKRHVLDAGRLHGDDTTVPLLARGGTKTARLWTYVRDDRPWDGGAPPAALFHFSTDRRKEHKPITAQPLIKTAAPWSKLGPGLRL
jgi:hypothetical protein